MNINHLKAFEKVIQVKSFQEAARQLAVSQPAITLRIQSLEEHFKTKLVKRTADGIQLTPQGESIYTKVREILRIWDELELQQLGGQPIGTLSIGASTIPSEYILPKIIMSFKRMNPDVDFSMKISGSRDVVEWLKNRTVDFSMTGEQVNEPNIYSVPILSETLAVIAPNEWNESNVHQFQDLLDCTWILRESNSATRASLEKVLHSHEHSTEQLKVVGELGSTEAVIASVEAGLGVSVVSSFAARKAKSFGRVKVIECPDFNVTRSFYFSCIEENKEHPLISAFLTFLRKEIEKKEGDV